MHYYSLNRQAPTVDFASAVMNGQAPDKGLYYPSTIPVFGKSELKELLQKTKQDIGFAVMRPFVGGCLPDETLAEIISETLNFDFPLIKVNDQVSSLELFHGPTLAFKDVGARFMSRCLYYFNKHEDKKTTVLVATSGDTGGAVASGFEGVSSVEVIILYPKGKVSKVQEMQLTSCGTNITALEVAGSFDDCQDIVKKAFADKVIQGAYTLTSANSINVARWLPQQLYYFLGYQQWIHEDKPIVSVPSGNFGNICAGLMAWAAGLPIRHFIAACNLNDSIPVYLTSGTLVDKPTIPTISNAMDVSRPSNFIRILELFGQHLPSLKQQFSAISIDEEATRNAIKNVFSKYHYLMDPHGAVGYAALAQYLERNPYHHGFFLETAHPVKFPDVVAQETGKIPIMPSSIEEIINKQRRSVPMEADFIIFKDWMMSRKK
jgi:threonine synthase